MAITAGTSEPSCFTIGDTVSWIRTEADYQAPAWNLIFGFSGPTRFTVASTDAGTDHLITLPTTGWKPGRYSWEAKATDGTQNIQIATGQISALPNLTIADPDLDALETALAIAEAAYNSIASGQMQSVSVDGISYTRSNNSSLQNHVLFLRREIQRLIKRNRALLGQATGDNFRLRFNQ